MATICCATVSAVGFAVFYASSDYRVRYGSLFICSPGAYAVMPTLSAWASNNSEPYKRKASTIGLGSMSGAMGSLLSAWIFVLGRPPRYHLLTGLSLAFGGILIIVGILNMIWLGHAQRNKLYKRNKLLEKFTIHNLEGSATQVESGQDQDLLSAQSWDHLGDQHPDFKYTY